MGQDIAALALVLVSENFLFLSSTEVYSDSNIYWHRHSFSSFQCPLEAYPKYKPAKIVRTQGNQAHSSSLLLVLLMVLEIFQ